MGDQPQPDEEQKPAKSFFDEIGIDPVVFWSVAGVILLLMIAITPVR